MTTGMSAPPIGSVIVTPKIRAAARTRSITGRFGVPVANRKLPDDRDSRQRDGHQRPPG